MKLTLTLAVTLTSVMVPVLGHLCLISPPQRGSMVGINKPAATDCILLKEPCGGRDKKDHIVGLMPGERFVVTFQKNLNHFNKTNPGYFSVRLMEADHWFAPGTELFKMADSTDPSLTLYSANITVPQDVEGHLILQARYVTNNAKAPLPVFYQCADLHVGPRVH